MDWLTSSSDTVKTLFWFGVVFVFSAGAEIARGIYRERQDRKRRLAAPQPKIESARSVFSIQRSALEAREEAERRQLAERQAMIERAYSLFSLLEKGGLEVRAIGAGLSCVRVRLKGNLRFPILVPAGTFFRCHTTTVQNMVCLRDSVFSWSLQAISPPVRITSALSGTSPDRFVIERLPKMPPLGSCLMEQNGRVAELLVPAACVDMDKPQPESFHEFTVLEPSRAGLSEDLQKLLGQLSQENGPLLSGDIETLPTKASLELNRLTQFAVWTITADPTRDGFAGIGILDSSATESFEAQKDRGHPTDDELSRIRSLLERSGLDPARYNAFR